MKKISLFLLALVCSVGIALANTESFDYADYKTQGTPSTGSEYTMVKTDVSIGDDKFYGNNNQAHFYAEGTITVTPKNGATITKVAITTTSTSYNGFQSSGQYNASTGSVATNTSNNLIVEWTGSATSAFTIGHTKQIRWTSIVVTYSLSGSGDGDGDGDGDEPAAPATITKTLYQWNGTGSTTAATQNGGTASVPVESSNNMVAGSSQKGNYCFKMNKGVSSSGGPFVILITLDKALKAGDKISGAVFRATETAATLGLDFLAADATASASYTVADPQVLSSNGTPADNIDYTVPQSADGATTIRLYRNAGSTGLYVSKLVVSREAVADVTITTAQYATFYNATSAFVMPEGLEGIVVDAINGNTLDLTAWYKAGDIVPAGEPLILHSTSVLAENTTFTLFVGTTSETALKTSGDNLLSGTSTADEMTTGGDVYYRLSQHNGEVGFYYGADDGAAFAPGANKAYLAVSTSAGTSAPERFIFGQQDVPTELQNVSAEAVSRKVMIDGRLYILRDGNLFDLNGRLVK